MALFDDILVAARGVGGAALGVVNETLGLYKYESSARMRNGVYESYFDIENNTMYLAPGLAGRELVSTYIHELDHGRSATEYIRLWDVAVQLNDRDLAINVTLNMEARAVFAQVGIMVSDANFHSVGYLTRDQIVAAVIEVDGRQNANRGALAWQYDLLVTLADKMAVRPDVMNDIIGRVNSVWGGGAPVANSDADYSRFTSEAYRTLVFADSYGGEDREVYDLYNCFGVVVGQATEYGVDSFLSVPAGIFDTFGQWFSWSEAAVNQASNELAADLFSSYGNSASGDELSFQVERLPAGDWRVSFTAVSENRQSSLLQKFLSTNQPHGIEEFVQWFQQRAEAMARDVLINNSAPIGGADSLAGAGDLMASAGEDSTGGLNTNSSKAPDKPGIGGLLPAADGWQGLDRPAAGPVVGLSTGETVRAANALIQSMAHWAPVAVDGDAFAGMNSHADATRQSQWTMAVGN